MSEPKAEEWAIKDEATSEWLTPLGTWSEESAWRTSEYQSAAAMYVTCVPKSRFSARIVPAPPREMTDAECWEWLYTYDTGVLCLSRYTDQWAIFNFKRIEGGHQVAMAVSPYDAIRAARRALEKRP